MSLTPDTTPITLDSFKTKVQAILKDFQDQLIATLQEAVKAELDPEICLAIVNVELQKVQKKADES